jgi:Rne/Rng family ribonuclease
MNKELFVSSTPHETKVGLVEDDLLAEIYLERENEYTLAGSIYKGRVTRVLPGMQSAFVDIGLERDAFLYVSDFMELEEHDEDVTDVVPANRAVPDMRPQAPRTEGQTQSAEATSAGEINESAGDGEQASDHAQSDSGGQSLATGSAEPGSSNAPEDRGNWRGRRRRRGGRGRDGRDRGPEPRFARPAPQMPETAAPIQESSRPRESSFRREPGRTQQSGPPPGYQPILLPGESISKYQRRSQPGRDQPSQRTAVDESAPAASVDSLVPSAATFPEDEPFFASASTVAEPLHEQHDDLRAEQDENLEAASTSVDWNREFRRPEPAGQSVSTASAAAPARSDVKSQAHKEEKVAHEPSPMDEAVERRARVVEADTPAFARSTGTVEEETIDEEEAEAIHYGEESGDDGTFDEFEEETRAAAEQVSGPGQEMSATVESVAEIQESASADVVKETGVAETAEEAEEEDSQELELEEAQAEAEALLDAEARSSGTVDARVEIRAPAATASYTQRAQRPRPGFDRQGGPRGRRGGGRRFRRPSQPVPQISELLKEGQEILVQIAKEPIGKKGARITSHIALPGRFLVYMPTVNHGGVSRKIASEEERLRLKRIVMSERENGHGGFIVRTAAQSASEDELRADIRFLKGLWNEIKTRAENGKSPALIYHDLNVVERVLRDQVTSDFSVIWVDTEPEYERILRFFNRFQPGLVKRVKLYTKETPLFEQFGLAEEMNKALKSKVWLKSGGYIVINQTEALVAVDINTGKYVGKTARLEDTIVKTNVDAIKEIVRQIRLRDLGGIIIIDFIDMDERRNRQRVMQALEEELRHDRAPSKVLQFNDFGLVAITRKRVKQSLERTIGAPCPYCQSTGYVKSVTTVCNEIYVEMRKIAKHLEHEDVMLRVNPDVAKELKSNNGRLLNEMEELSKRTIIVKSDPALHQEQFDIN